jgi:hypothetical protein
MNILSKPTNLLTGKKLLCTALIGGLIAFASCNKKDNSPSAVSEANATEVVTEAVAPNSGGVTAELQGTAIIDTNSNYRAACGVIEDTTISGAGSIGNINWNYIFNWQWTLTCGSGNAPSQFTFNFSARIGYQGPIMSSNDTTSSTYLVTGLDPSSSQWAVNATYNRTGVKELNDGSLSFVGHVQLLSSNIVVTKSSQQIASGTATIEFDGYDNLNKSFNYSATLVFNGNRTATITYSSGHTANISW